MFIEKQIEYHLNDFVFIQPHCLYVAWKKLFKLCISWDQKKDPTQNFPKL